MVSDELRNLHEALEAAEEDRDRWERHWREAAEGCESCANNNWEEKAAALLAENRLLIGALEDAIEWMEWSTDNLDAHPDATLAAAYEVLAVTPLAIFEVERARRLEAVAQAARALLDERGVHIEGCVPLKNALAALEDE